MICDDMFIFFFLSLSIDINIHTVHVYIDIKMHNTETCIKIQYENNEHKHSHNTQTLPFPSLLFRSAQSLSLESAIHLDREAAQRTDAGRYHSYYHSCTAQYLLSGFQHCLLTASFNITILNNV